MSGIRIQYGSASNGLIHHNVISDHSSYGIYISTGDNWAITNNTIRWIGQYGIYLTSSSGDEVYYNMIGPSGTANAYSSVAQNFDDGVDTGNWWSDYSGSMVWRWLDSWLAYWQSRRP